MMTISTLLLGYKHYGKLIIKRLNIIDQAPLFIDQRTWPFIIQPRFIQPFTQL